MDKSAVAYDDGTKQQIGTNYTKTKPVIEGAKPSNLRAKFENLAKVSEEENRKRADEQKRIREAKDKHDREEASKKTIVESTPLPQADEAKQPPPKGARSTIVTGREGGIGNAISAFNQMQSPTKEDAPVIRKEPIHIPREAPKQIVVKEDVKPEPVKQVEPVKLVEPTKQVEPVNQVEPVVEKVAEQKVVAVAPPPDLIPSIEIETVATPPEIHSPEPVETVVVPPNVVEEPFYQNQAEVQSSTIAEKSNTEMPEATVSAADSEIIPSTSDNLADYIEDTNIHAISLYDYQANDDDEISFDPDDLITHIEMVSDQ